jgi:hypothetical protein
MGGQAARVDAVLEAGPRLQRSARPSSSALPPRHVELFSGSRIGRAWQVHCRDACAVHERACDLCLQSQERPNGRVIYGDTPTAGAKHTEKITVRTDTFSSAAAAETPKRALQMSRQHLLSDSAARNARLGQLESQIAETYSELQRAQAEREAGREVQEGDRQGRRQTAQVRGASKEA